MLTGLGDVENLAWKLALVCDGRADAALLDTYEAERRPLATDVLRGTSAITKLNVAQGRVGRFIRDRIAAPVFNVPALQRWATYQTSQLWVNYRRGPLAERSLLTRKPRPGDRVADHECTRPDGGSTRLYAELRGHWALMLPDSEDAPYREIARKHLGDKVVSLRRDIPADADVLLIRPDGHLAWRGQEPEGMDRWLRHALVTGRIR